MPRRSLLLVAASVSLLAAAPACSSKKPPAAAPLPSYTGEQAALFSDLFRPELFGIDGAQRPERDALLDDRGQRADYIGPVRVVTVTRQARGDFRSYTVVVEPTSAPWRGSLAEAKAALTVADGSPAFAWLEIAGEKWVGTRLLLFVRNYQDGAHFYGTVDTPEVRLAAQPPKPPPAPSSSAVKPALK